MFQIEEGVHKGDVLFFQRFHIVFDGLRIGGDDGTVIMVIGSFFFLYLIEDARIENRLHTPMNEVHNVPMNEFRGITNRFRWNRLHAFFKDGLGGTGGNLHAKSQLRKEGKPEGIILVHVQGSRQADDPSPDVYKRQPRC